MLLAQFEPTVLLIVFIAVLLFSFLLLLIKRYRRCPSNKVLVVYGKVAGAQAAKCVHGGAAFIWPVVQDYAYLDLEPIQIEIPLKGALSLENIRVNVPSVFTVAIGTEPTIMLTGPAPSARKALDKAGLSVEDIDLFEVNEAFSSVVLKFVRDMGISEDKVNVNGGAIALGHPLGATGCMILSTLLDELERRDLRRGLATLCVGGGMGIATIIERV